MFKECKGEGFLCIRVLFCSFFLGVTCVVFFFRDVLFFCVVKDFLVYVVVFVF